MTKRYALIGAAGFVAPRHMKAIKETGGELVAACDLSDSVGILDRYFPDCEFFISPERFERHVEKIDFDYFVVCTPNYLHDNHIRMGLRAEANVICEKPMVIKSKNVESLIDEAAFLGKEINVIQQLRLHPNATTVRNIKYAMTGRKSKIMVNYITPRGKWYHRSWKGDREKSGGLAMNIGVHIFDLLISVFGPVVESYANIYGKERMMGRLELKYADVEWCLSTGKYDPERSLIINDRWIDLSKGFENLHIKSYKEILAGRGFGPNDVLPALELVESL